MQRTYGRRALRRRSGVQSQTRDHNEPDDLPLSDPSPPRKRHKVVVEIVSPNGHSSVSTHTQSNTRKLDISGLKPTATRLEPASGSPKTPERSPRRSASLYTTPQPHHSRSGSQPPRGSIVKRMLGRSRTESSLEGLSNFDFLTCTSYGHSYFQRHPWSKYCRSPLRMSKWPVRRHLTHCQPRSLRGKPLQKLPLSHLQSLSRAEISGHTQDRLAHSSCLSLRLTQAPRTSLRMTQIHTSHTLTCVPAGELTYLKMTRSHTKMNRLQRPPL
jgi:hypothetical protein